jgi:CDP-paratose 2-epimerase
MSVGIVTGSAGLIGSEAVRFFSTKGLDIIGLENNMRAKLFGPDASTAWVAEALKREVKNYTHLDLDIRDREGIFRTFSQYGKNIALVIHTAAQPSHDWAARDPMVDFDINATGTLNLLEASRQFAPEAVFIFTSTNKVYGDRPNQLPLIELDSRWEIEPSHPYQQGIPETMAIDGCLHSLFGASKVAADILVQEYGRYFSMRTGCFRGGCLTGPNHSGTELHGFLSYLIKCAVTGQPYTVFGYKGKQVRDNIHSADLIRAFDAFFLRSRAGEVFNIGGGRFSSCSVLEAIEMCEQITHRRLNWHYVDKNRKGDHIWWISDLSHFQSLYPEWHLRYNVPQIMSEIYEDGYKRWAAA